MRRLALALACLAATVAFAEPAGVELRPFGARENLDNGFEDWREAGAELAWRNTEGRLLYLRGRETERYGLRDREAAAGLALPIAPAWQLAIEATGTRDAQVLPEWSAIATLYRKLEGGWVASGSWKELQYVTSGVSTATAGIERYIGALRLAYTGYLSRPHGQAWSPTHRVVAAWYGDGLTRLELGAARGRESENTPAGLITSNVRGYTFSGTLGLSPAWALTLDVEHQQQGDFYTRETIRLGARVFF